MNERIQQEILEAEAVEQFLRLNETADRARRAAEFSEWLTRSPAHVEAFLVVASTWEALGFSADAVPDSAALIAAARAEPDPDNVVMLPRATTPLRQRHHWNLTHVWRAVAAVAVFAVTGWIGYAYVAAANVFRNDGQQVQHVTLPDGSLVSLNPNSEIHLRWTAKERRLDLRYGRARFQVAKNPQRPFLVDTAQGTVRAVGTIFDVDAQRLETRITVIEGRVLVQGSGSPAYSVAPKATSAVHADRSLQLSAGDRAEISSEESAGKADIPPSVLAWTEQRVVFRGATLDKVIDEFNRYRGRPVIINDSALTPMIISGVFDPKNPESLLSYLELYEDVKVERLEDGSVLLSRQGKSAEVARQF